VTKPGGWSCASDFAQRFPNVRVDPDVLYVDEGDIVTSAGTAAGIDCCRHLLRQRHGAAAANSVARRLVVPPHRQGGQAQFIERPLPSSARDSRLSILSCWTRFDLRFAKRTPWTAWRCWLPRSFTNHRTVLASLCDRVMCTGGGAMRNGIGFGLGLLI
jgi:hypothetical protein